MAKTRKVTHPFQGGRSARSLTKKHEPLIWENMLGTVYARAPNGHISYFDYDYDAAHAFAEVGSYTDLRVAAEKHLYSYTGYHHHYSSDGPRAKQIALWGVRDDAKRWACSEPETGRACEHCKKMEADLAEHEKKLAKKLAK